MSLDARAKLQRPGGTALDRDERVSGHDVTERADSSGRGVRASGS